jgi:hypothetical protein
VVAVAPVVPGAPVVAGPPAVVTAPPKVVVVSSLAQALAMKPSTGMDIPRIVPRLTKSRRVILPAAYSSMMWFSMGLDRLRMASSRSTSRLVILRVMSFSSSGCDHLDHHRGGGHHTFAQQVAAPKT